MNLVKKHEGLSLVAYFDPVGVPTIGWGHTKTVTRADVLGGKKITLAEAQRLFDDDIAAAQWAAIAVTGLTSGPVFEGVTSFVFNLGPKSLHGSSTKIAYWLINKNYNKAYVGMQRYVYAGGRKLRGLVKRREEEGQLVLRGNVSK
jgi:GH24 family phage-related lysozyme (muramidase)